MKTKMKRIAWILAIAALACSPTLFAHVHAKAESSAVDDVRCIKRVGQVIGLKPQFIDEYKRIHADDHPNVRDLLNKYHIHNFSIFLHEIDGKWYEFGYFEYTGEEYEADMAKLAAEPRNIEWLNIGDYSQSWCYQRYTPKPIRKSVGQLLLQLITIAANEGNLLLNVGPKPDGTIPEEDAERLRGMGKWLRTNGEAIYGSERSPIIGNSVTKWIFKGNTGYACLPCWPKDELRFCHLSAPAESAKLLATGNNLHLSYDHDLHRLVISGLPETPPDPDISIVKVVFPTKPEASVLEDATAWLRPSA